jgi:hypothetical protein
MKALILLLTVLASFNALSAQATSVSGAGIDPRHLNSILDRVRNCAILPYSLNERGQKVYHAIQSHCPEVRVIAPGQARVRVFARAFLLIIEAPGYSDGDFFNLRVKELQSGSESVFEGILAFGDVLLAMLGGRTEGLQERLVAHGPALEELDRNLLKLSL